MRHLDAQRPWLELKQGPHTVFWFEDFMSLPSMSGTEGAADIYLEETNAGATELLDPTETGGVLKGTHTAADPDIISMFWNHGVKLSDLKAGEALEFGIRMKTSIVANCDLFTGLGIHDADYTSLPADFWMFQILESEADGKLGINVSKDSVDAPQTGLIQTANAGWLRAFMRYTPGTVQDIGSMEWWADTTVYRHGYFDVDGVFPDDVILRPFYQRGTGEAVAHTFGIDWMYLAGVRADYVEGTG